jgi:hypothetical protein
MDRTGRTAYDVEYQLKTRSQGYRRFRARGATLRDASGNPLRVAGSLTDITDQKRRSEELEAAMVRFKSSTKARPRVFGTSCFRPKAKSAPIRRFGGPTGFAHCSVIRA